MALEIVSTMTSKGQITVPIEIRRHFGLQKGAKLAFLVDEDGSVRVKLPAYPDIESLRGIAGCMKTPTTWEEVEEIAEAEWAAESIGKVR